MRRTLLQGSGVLLIALTVWALALLLMTTLGTEPTFFASGWLSEGGAQEVVVAEVLAANRLRLSNGQEVRLAAIEVPAPGQRFAEEGKQATRALAQGKRVRLEGELDNAYVYLPGGELLQEMLISGGYARLERGLPQSDLVAQLRSAEAQAQNRGLGLWEGGPPPITQPTLVPTSAPVTCDASLIPEENSIGVEQAKEQIGKEVTVVFFPVRAQSQNGNITLLAGVQEDTFGILIPAGLASTVEQPEILFLNRCVAVSGLIERGADAGPRIRLRAFNQVVILR
jgi:hypothetical protein